jgi:membrane-bound serine protease (ClpP class)
MWFLLGLFLIVLAAVLLVVEIFVPSFGLLAACAIASLTAGIWVFFSESTAAGWAGVGITAVVVPIVWIITYRLFPNTSFGKSVTLEGPERDKGDAIPDTPDLAKLLGETGVVITPLRPVGMCEFDGQRFECVAETGYVEKEEKISVIHVEGTQLTVRLIEDK